MESGLWGSVTHLHFCSVCFPFKNGNFSSLDKNDFMTFVPVTQELQTPWHLKIGRITKHPFLATQNTKPVEPGRFKWTSEALLPLGLPHALRIWHHEAPSGGAMSSARYKNKTRSWCNKKSFWDTVHLSQIGWVGTGYLQIILNSWDFQREAKCVILIFCYQKMKCQILMRGISRSTSPSRD